MFEPEPKFLVRRATAPSGSPSSFPFKTQARSWMVGMKTDHSSCFCGWGWRIQAKLTHGFLEGSHWSEAVPGAVAVVHTLQAAVALSDFTTCNSSLRNAARRRKAPFFSPQHWWSFQGSTFQHGECHFPPAVCCWGLSAFWLSWHNHICSFSTLTKGPLALFWYHHLTGSSCSAFPWESQNSGYRNSGYRSMHSRHSFLPCFFHNTLL